MTMILKYFPLLLSLTVDVCFSDTCVWPNTWTPEKCGLPVCPDCSLVTCVEDLKQSDCPEGTYLQQDKLLGCCPACVRFLEYGDTCPGLTWTRDAGNIAQPGNIVYGEDSSDSRSEWPNSFIGQSTELDCVKTKLGDAYFETQDVELQERVERIEWVESLEADRHVPVIHVSHCRPDLTCQKLSYRDCGHDCTKYSPGKGPGSEGWTEGASEDEYPICNPAPVPAEDDESGLDGVVNGLKDEADCVGQPCTCHAADYKLWVERQWGEDCSYQPWAPACDLRGVYSAVQHKHSSTQDKMMYRWCSAPTGDRIYGRERHSDQVSSMTCSCSQKRWELEQTKVGEAGEVLVDGRDDVSLHCTDNGNYEVLQCDQGLCWCADQVSGEVKTRVVPQTVVSVLPCYPSYPENATLASFGSQYLRKCDSRAVGVSETKKMFEAHGVNWTPSREYDCDYNGGFAPVQCDDMCQCWSPSGQQLGAYAVELEQGDRMTCSCARDEEDTLTGGRRCDPYGNYRGVQLEDGSEFCVDPLDGWRVSGKVPSSKKCCLDTEFYRAMDPLAGQHYRTTQYIMWDKDNQPSYNCRAPEYSSDGSTIVNCVPCQEEIMRCNV